MLLLIYGTDEVPLMLVNQKLFQSLSYSHRLWIEYEGSIIDDYDDETKMQVIILQDTFYEISPLFFKSQT